MARGANRVFLLGNVREDPEVRATPGGLLIANFTLATAERTKSQDGHWTDTTEWHNLVAFQRTAEIVRDHVKMGTHLFIEGKTETRSWDDKRLSEKKYTTEIVVLKMSLLGDDQDSERAALDRANSS